MHDTRWLPVVLVAACGPPDEVPRTVDPSVRSAVTGSLDPALPFGNELTIAMTGAVSEQVRRAIEAGIRKIQPEVAACMEGIFGTAPLEATIDVRGKVTAKVTTGLLRDTPIAACIERAWGKLAIGAVKGAPIEIRYPVRNMPSAEQMREAAGLLRQR